MHLIIKCIKHSLNVFTGTRTASVGQDLVFELFCQLRNVHNVNKQGGYQNNMVHFTTYHSLVISFSKKKTWIFNLCRLAFKTGLWFNSGLVEATTNSAVINENNLLFVFFLGGGGNLILHPNNQHWLVGWASSTLLMQQGSWSVKSHYKSYQPHRWRYRRLKSC